MGDTISNGNFVPGGKIKNIRAETNTYIKTPKRDEEPVFVITGQFLCFTSGRRDGLAVRRVCTCTVIPFLPAPLVCLFPSYAASLLYIPLSEG